MLRFLNSFLWRYVALTALFGSFCAPGVGEETWTLPLEPPSWAREDGALTVAAVENITPEGKAATHVVYTGERDWALRIPAKIDVKPGEIFTIRYRGKNCGEKAVRPSVVLYGEDDKATDWIFGGQEELPYGDWRSSETKFVVPYGVAKIEPRVVGDGKTDAYLEVFKLERTGALPLSSVKGTFPAENERLHVQFKMEDASFSVLDVRTGRRWEQTVEDRSQLFVLNAQPIPQGVDFELFDAQSFLAFHATVELEKDTPEIVVRLKADPQADQPEAIHYPYPFASRTTDRAILPMNEGISFPTTENPPGLSSIYTFGTFCGHGLCMAFWGFVNDTIDPTRSDGYMGIVETPDDSIVLIRPFAVDPKDPQASNPEAKTLSAAQAWLGPKKLFGYDKSLRLVFFNEGGYVAMCKRYREYARKIGLLVSFDEKIKRNPNLAEGIERLVGAANIWSWDGDKLETIHKLQEMGFDHILWSAGGDARQIKEMNALEGVLTSRYDIYQDVMDPARYPELPGVHNGWIPEAWPKDIAWDSPDGHWTRGWSVDAKDKTKPRIPCGVLCDLKAVPYAEKRLGELLETTPYRCQFIDTTVASPWRECWNPEHPMTRSESKVARMALLGLLGKRFNLVCGSETGIDSSVPFCDYYEGMMSIGPYRCPEAGRYIERIWDEVPELVEKYQLGETYRLPLFELVYHGCVVSYWYWGDNNDKFPACWLKRDLFNALYGVPPLYGFKRDFLDKNRERFIESYKIAEPVSRLTGRVEMTDHQILTEDRRVQRTVFSNGISVVVNFGDQDYRYADVVVPAKSSKIFGVEE